MSKTQKQQGGGGGERIRVQASNPQLCSLLQSWGAKLVLPPANPAKAVDSTPAPPSCPKSWKSGGYQVPSRTLLGPAMLVWYAGCVGHLSIFPLSQNLIREGGVVGCVGHLSQPCFPDRRQLITEPPVCATNKTTQRKIVIVHTLLYSNIYLHFPFLSWTLAWLNMKLQVDNNAAKFQFSWCHQHSHQRQKSANIFSRLAEKYFRPPVAKDLATWWWSQRNQLAIRAFSEKWLGSDILIMTSEKKTNK